MPTCSVCFGEVPSAARVCRSCGASQFRDTWQPASTPPHGPSPASRSLNIWALVSLVCGVLQFAGAFGLGTIGAIVAGHIGRAQISRSHGRQSGSGLAVTGLVLGYAGLLIFAFAVWVLSGFKS